MKDLGEQSIWAALTGDLGSGQLRLEPAAVRALITECERYIATMDDLRSRFAWRERSHGYGNLPSGQAVGRHFLDKQDEMVAVLGAYIDVANRMREVFAAAAQRYEAAHGEHVEMLRTAE